MFRCAMIFTSSVLMALLTQCRVQADISSFRDYFEEVPGSVVIFGDSELGNGLEFQLNFENISTQLFRIDDASSAIALDPEDLGFPDVGPGNIQDAIDALEAAHPGHSYYTGLWFSPRNPPRKEWLEFDVSLDEPGGFVVAPGETFSLSGILRNDSFGPDFRRRIGTGGIPNWQVDAVGELVLAFDVQYTAVPEPSTWAACCLASAGLWWRWRRKLKAA